MKVLFQKINRNKYNNIRQFTILANLFVLIGLKTNSKVIIIQKFILIAAKKGFMKSNHHNNFFSKKLLLILIVLITVTSCKKHEKKGEQLTFAEHQQQNEPTGISTVGDSISNQFASSSGSVLLTGMDRIRLIPVYKIKPKADRDLHTSESSTYYDYYGENNDEDFYRYFMPGIDIIYGYNLINIGHYDIQKDTLSYFFDKPVLIKTLYFPGLKSDSLMHKAVSRDYFMVSVYDEDTNLDSLINNKDMRRLYHIDQFNSKKTSLLPEGHSAIKSTYDYKNDIMYIYTRHDANKNGIPEKNEPISIFWIRLNEPTVVRKMN